MLYVKWVFQASLVNHANMLYACSLLGDNTESWDWSLVTTKHALHYEPRFIRKELPSLFKAKVTPAFELLPTDRWYDGKPQVYCWIVGLNWAWKMIPKDFQVRTLESENLIVAFKMTFLIELCWFIFNNFFVLNLACDNLQKFLRYVISFGDIERERIGEDCQCQPPFFR